jgi:hypothetical protein
MRKRDSGEEEVGGSSGFGYQMDTDLSRSKDKVKKTKVLKKGLRNNMEVCSCREGDSYTDAGRLDDRNKRTCVRIAHRL